MSSSASSLSYNPEVPPIGNPDDINDQRHATACRIFLNAQIRVNTMKRCELEREWNRARMKDAGHHWIRPLRGSGSGRLWYAWEPIRLGPTDAKFPMPKRPIFSAAIQDEVARIIGVGSKPFVRIDDPEKSEGAMIAKKVLLDRNDKTGWNRDARRGAYHAAMFGQWIEEGYWLTTRLKTVRGPVLTAMKCSTPGCGLLFADANLPPPLAAQVRQTNPGAVHGVVDMQTGIGAARLGSCPQCGGRLVPEEGMAPETFKTQPDALGRPLYKDRPMGEDMTRVLSPYGFFPKNQGIGYDTDEQMESYAIREFVTLNTLKAEYENGGQVKACTDAEMFRRHPVVTTMGMTYAMEGVWAGYAARDRWYQKPTVDFPRGRAIEMAGPVLLYDGDLYIPGTDIPRSEVRIAQWELREGEIWGKSLAEDLHSVQDNINSGLSQAMDIQQKWTNPKIVLHEGMNLDMSGGANSKYSSDIWTVNMRGITPEIAAKFPYEFGNKGAPGSLWQMFDRDKDHVAIITGAQAAETGAVSGVELNYSALVFAAKKSSERRGPRNDGIRYMKARIWSHRLRLVAGLYREDRLIHYKDDSNKEQVKQIRGMALMGQTDVGLEEEPIVDSAIADRAAIEQALGWGTIKTSANGGTFSTDRRVNRAIGVPEELSEERNQQEDNAIDEWRQWVNDGVEPFIDQQGDQHDIHYTTHMSSIEATREAKDLREAIREQGFPWAWYLKATWEWERLHGDLTMRADVLRSAPQPQMLAEQGVPPEEIQRAMQQMEMARQSLGAWPAAMELQIYEVWKRLVLAFDPTGAAWRSPEAQKLIRFKAHMLAAWKLMQLQAQAMAAAAAPPVPGGAPRAAKGPTPAEAAGAPAAPGKAA